MSDSLRDYAEQSLGGDSSGLGVEVAADCIECGKEQKMYINTDTGLVYCFSCDYRANLVKLLQDVEGIPWALALERSIKLLSGLRTAHRAKSFEALRDVLQWGLQTRQAADVVVACPLPNHAVRIGCAKAADARAYLRRRGFGKVHWGSYRLKFVCERDEEAKRFYRHIIFPVYDARGQVTYWTTRAAYEPPKKIPKSYHPQGVDKKLFGIDAVPLKRSTCILVEGPLDAVALPRIGVALLGKTLTQAQAEELAQRFRRVVLCLDRETQHEMYDAFRTLRACGVKRVDVVERCPWKDPAEGVNDVPRNTVRKILARAESCTMRMALRLRLT